MTNVSSTSPIPQSVPLGQAGYLRGKCTMLSLWVARHAGLLTVEMDLLIGVLVLAVTVLRAGRGPLPGDVGLALWWQRLILPHAWLTNVIECVSTINFPVPAALLIVLVTLFLLLLRRTLDVPLSLGTLAMADSTTYLLNAFVRRLRPGRLGILVLRHITTDFSFPSGHVEHAVAYLGTLVFLSFHIQRSVVGRQGAIVWELRILTLVTILLMLPSRVLEGEQWPIDGLAAWREGLFWLLLAIHTYFWAARRWPYLLGIQEPRPKPYLSEPQGPTQAPLPSSLD